MKYIVRCHPRRLECVEYLQRHLPAETLYLFDRQNAGARKNLHHALDIAGDDATLHFEEDIWLTENFIEKARNIIAAHTAEVIQFFSMRKADLEIGSRVEPGRTFMMTQCFYLPKTYSRQLLDFYPNWQDRDKHLSASDIFLADFLKSRKEKYFLHVPSLVEHRSIVSIIDRRRSRNRQSKTFENGIYE